MKSIYSILILAAFIATPASANTSYYQTHSAYTYGPSHNNYNGKAPVYGPSTNNYNGQQTYGAAPKTGGPTTPYNISKQSLETSIPY